MMLITKPRNKEEVKEYYDLRWEIMREPFNKPKYSQKEIENDDGIHLIMYLDKVPVGIANAYKKSKSEAEIYTLGIKTEYTGKGYGTILLKHMEKELKKIWIKQVVVNSRKSATKFYIKNKYQKIKEGITNDYGKHDVLKISL